jgi:O-antigen/teichoic acid export membrane protein
MIRDEIKFLLTHSSIYGLGTVVSRLIAFLLLPLYTRYLTPSDYGLLETVDLSTGLIGMVVTVGIVRALSRFYYESDDQKERNRVVSTTYLTYSAFAMAFILITFYLSGPLSKLLFKTSSYTHFFAVGFLSLALGGISDIGMIYLRLVKAPLKFITITLTRLMLLIGLNIFFIVYLGKGVLGVLYSTLIANAFYASLLTLLILWKKGLRFSPAISWQMVKYALPMMPSNVGSAAVKQSDKYFVLYFLSVADMGIYSLALKIGNAIHDLVTVPFNLAYIPRRFEIMKQNDAGEIYRKIFTYYMFGLIFVGLSFSMLIPEILRFMVTPRFMRAGNLVPLVVFSMIIYATHYHFDFGILYTKKTKYFAYIGVSSAAVQIGLNFVLVPKFGLYGAVAASILSLAYQAGMLLTVSRNLYHIAYEFKRILAFLCLAGFFYAVSVFAHTSSLMLTIVIKLGMLILLPVIASLLRILKPNEIARIKEVYATSIRPGVSRFLCLRSAL